MSKSEFKILIEENSIIRLINVVSLIIDNPDDDNQYQNFLYEYKEVRKFLKKLHSAGIFIGSTLIIEYDPEKIYSIRKTKKRIDAFNLLLEELNEIYNLVHNINSISGGNESTTEVIKNKRGRRMKIIEFMTAFNLPDSCRRTISNLNFTVLDGKLRYIYYQDGVNWLKANQKKFFPKGIDELKRLIKENDKDFLE